MEGKKQFNLDNTTNVHRIINQCHHVAGTSGVINSRLKRSSVTVMNLVHSLKPH